MSFQQPFALNHTAHLTLIPSQVQDTAKARPSYTLLKYQRRLRGWTQQEVADKLYGLCVAAGSPDVGINKKMISSWEGGKHVPSLFYQRFLCLLFEASPVDLGLLPPLV